MDVIISRAALFFLIGLLVGCGGGGSNGSTSVPSGSNSTSSIISSSSVSSSSVASSSSSSSIIPVPTLSFTISSNKIRVGDDVTLTWSSFGADSCAAITENANLLVKNSSVIAGGVVELTGSKTVSIDHIGQYTVTITCTNKGGSVSKFVSVNAAQLLSKLSIENRSFIISQIGQHDLTIPDGTPTCGGLCDIAFADFRQDGSTLLFIGNTDVTISWPSPIIGSFHFWEKTANGWKDVSSKMLDSIVGCVNPRRALVADFNNDGFPDVFVACNGFDGDGYKGENQRVILSNGDGTFKNVEILNSAGYTHGATTADLNGDGAVDVIVADFTRSWDKGTPIYVLTNLGNGSFVQNFDLTANMGLKGQGFWSVEAVNINGKLNLIMGGTESNQPLSPCPQILEVNKSGVYDPASRKLLPCGTTANDTVVDFAVDGDYLYVNRVLGKDYSANSIQKISISKNESLSEVQIVPKYAPYWVPFIEIFGDKLISLDARNGFSIPK